MGKFYKGKRMFNELLSKSKNLNLSVDLSFDDLLVAVTQALKLSNVKVIYNYPGRPASLLLDEVRKSAKEIDVQDYLPNEFVATAKGFGSSVAGCERSLVVFKDVGTNVACDHFYCLNHIGINRGLVFFIADDPSAWASQNEEDSRGIYFNAGLPILEPCDQYSAYYCTLLAYELSEKFRLPFFIRTTARGIREKYNSEKNDFKAVNIPLNLDYIDIPFDAKDRWTCIFRTVEEDREELSEKQNLISKFFDTCNLNVVKGSSKLGIIASGFPATQLENEGLLEGVSLLKLIFIFPLPEEIIINFLKDKDRILVIDQGEPLLELLIRDCAQRHGFITPIFGKLNGYVRKVGEFRDDDLKLSVNALKENKSLGKFPPHKIIAHSRSHVEDSGFYKMLQALKEAVLTTGVRPLYAGDAGEPCRIPETKGLDDMLHMETTMGCAISYLSGAIESFKRKGESLPFKPIAYVGDSDFFHSAFSGICEAASKNHPILMLLIDNQGAVSTGKQPHLGMKINDQIKELSIKDFLHSMKINTIEEVLASDKESLTKKIIDGIKSNDFYCIIVHVN